MVNKQCAFNIKAKKQLTEIKEHSSPNPVGSPVVEVEDCGTQMSAEKAKEPPPRKKSRRHALYKEPLQISEPLDCGQFIVSITYYQIQDIGKLTLGSQNDK